MGVTLKLCKQKSKKLKLGLKYKVKGNAKTGSTQSLVMNEERTISVAERVVTAFYPFVQSDN